MEIKIKIEWDKKFLAHAYEVSSDLEDFNISVIRGTGFPFTMALHGIFEAIWQFMLGYMVRTAHLERQSHPKDEPAFNYPSPQWRPPADDSTDDSQPKRSNRLE